MTSKLNAVPTYVRADEFIWPKVRTLLDDETLSLYLVNNNRVINGGSREHYFHFLLGYLLPLIHEQEHRKAETFNVLDCGPLMTPILRETLNRCGYTFSVISLDQITNPCLLENWDYVWEDGTNAENTFRRVTRLWENYDCPCGHTQTSDTLLIKRSPPVEYYNSDLVEIKGYGTGRREITNWQAVSDYLAMNGVDHLLYEPGIHRLGCQINTFHQAKKIVGARGAEWANIVWCKPGLKVKVYDPTPPATILSSFLQRRHVQFEFEIMGSAKDQASPEKVLKFLKK